MKYLLYSDKKENFFTEYVKKADGIQPFLTCAAFLRMIIKKFLDSERVQRMENGKKAGENQNMRTMKNCRLLLFDLDGTLLTSNKTISKRTKSALNKCREKGMLIGVSTSRGRQNALAFIGELKPDVLITSGGALVYIGEQCVYRAEFSAEETKELITQARAVCGADCEITVDTMDQHFWNYKVDPKKQDASWGDSVYTDFHEFGQPALKVCVEIPKEQDALLLKERMQDYDCARFSDGFWYKFTKKSATKERAIAEVCRVLKMQKEEIAAFGDDYADSGMLAFCGWGIAMGNAIPSVKEHADIVIGSNDEDGIAEYLERTCL